MLEVTEIGTMELVNIQELSGHISGNLIQPFVLFGVSTKGEVIFASFNIIHT